MESISGISSSSQLATDGSLAIKEVIRPERVLTSTIALDEGQLSERVQHGSNNESHHLTYFCTFCNDFEHKDLVRWQLHEYHSHQWSRHMKCPECFALDYNDAKSTERDQRSTSKQVNSLPANASDTNEYCQRFCKRKAAIGKGSFTQRFWGCGFCCEGKTIPMKSWKERRDHVASHIYEGKRKDDWMFTNLIKGLLRQPNISEIWTCYLHGLHGSNAADHPEFKWSETNALCQRILRKLEIASYAVNEQTELVKMAYIMGANESTYLTWVLLN